MSQLVFESPNAYYQFLSHHTHCLNGCWGNPRVSKCVYIKLIFTFTKNLRCAVKNLGPKGSKKCWTEISDTLPKTNSSHLGRRPKPKKETHLNQPQCFRCELLVSGRVYPLNRWNKPTLRILDTPMAPRFFKSPSCWSHPWLLFPPRYRDATSQGSDVTHQPGFQQRFYAKGKEGCRLR